ncbi:hypothetical protein [Brevundimonas olei]|uniref:hypothetical protein n=1 Tax=Brevundimonas olei TaxID=657642 RepID=UPI0031CF80F6
METENTLQYEVSRLRSVRVRLGTLTTKASTFSAAKNAVVETAAFVPNGNPIKVTLDYRSYGRLNNHMTNQAALINSSDCRPNSAVIKLYRSINNAAYVEVATLNAVGVWTSVGRNTGDFYYTQEESTCSGSLTFTDREGSTQNRRYKAVIETRDVTEVDGQGQNLSVICVEE